MGTIPSKADWTFLFGFGGASDALAVAADDGGGLLAVMIATIGNYFARLDLISR